MIYKQYLNRKLHSLCIAVLVFLNFQHDAHAFLFGFRRELPSFVYFLQCVNELCCLMSNLTCTFFLFTSSLINSAEAVFLCVRGRTEAIMLKLIAWF
jgi:hypothetical protein